MRKSFIALGLCLGLAGCLTIADVVTWVSANAKTLCTIAVDATDLANALSGLDPSKIDQSGLVAQLCAQYKAAVGPAPAPVSGQAPKVANKCETVLINGHPVKVNCS